MNYNERKQSDLNARMNGNEVQTALREARAADRKRFNDSLSAGHQQATKTIVEMAAASYEVAVTEAARVRTETEQANHEIGLRESLKESYIAANGSEFGFTDAYPRLRAAWVEAQALANVTPKAISPVDIARKTLKQQYS